MMNIELTIYPSGGGEVGYLIIVENDTLKTMLKDIGAVNDSIVLTTIKKEKSIILTSTQQDSIISLLNIVDKDFKDNNDVFMFDTWIYVIAIDGREVVRFNSLTILENMEDEQLKSLQKIIQSLIKLSPFKVDLQGFS